MPEARQPGRLESLDAFRGATIAAMILVNNPGTWDAVYPPLRHADWHGWTFTDLIFPFFLWISGVALTLSFAKRVERGDSRRRLFLHTLRRAACIFGLGLLLNGFPYYHLATLRIPGVLQRIAVCYLIAGALFLVTGLRGQVAALVSLLGVYWALMKCVPVPGYGAGVLDKHGNFAQWIDSLTLSGHMWANTKTWDPEGIVSTLPAIATVLFGILCGHLLRGALTLAEKATWMFTAGAALIFAGLLMDVWLPINKSLWTSSFAAFMAGMAFTIFGLCYWLIDGRGYGRWAKPFAIFGMNAITVYVMSGLLGDGMALIQWAGAGGKPVSLHAWVFGEVFLKLASPVNASLLFAITHVLVLYLVALLMWRKKWFIRL
ncbi:MAG: heparan-alpha-glucosaminide N-acetyltransferase domain-containing protein [Acidobacteriota bacterium]